MTIEAVEVVFECWEDCAFVVIFGDRRVGQVG